MKYNHVVFDINILINFVINKTQTQPIDKLINACIHKQIQGWIAAQSLSIFAANIEQELINKGQDSHNITKTIKAKTQWICTHFNLLSLPGEESKSLIDCASNLEQAQVTLAALTLGEDVCIVTENNNFDNLNKIPILTPSELLTSEKEEEITSVTVLDLAPQRRTILPQLESNIREVISSSQYILGPQVKYFEEEVKEYLGVKHTIGVNSGTDALIIGLRALDIGAGDEVITTPFSFFATAESISNVGAKPVFVDIESETFNIDPKKIIQKITDKTKAIMPVHLYGNPAALAQIMDIANKYNLKVIEDCAQSFGAVYHGTCITCKDDCRAETRKAIAGKFTGTIGDVGAYSFFPSKNLGAYGDGGLIATNDDKIAELARMLRVHGSQKKYHNELFGYNSRLDSLQAAILRVKLPHIDSWNEQRRRVAKTYNQLLANVEEVITPNIADGHVFHQYTIRILNGKREAIQTYLKDNGISTMTYYPVPQDRLPVYQGQYQANPVSDRLSYEVLSLPIWPELEERVIKKIVATIKQGLTN